MRKVVADMDSNFNSIKVRLRHSKGTPLNLNSSGFQFHKGSIKTCMRKLFLKLLLTSVH